MAISDIILSRSMTSQELTSRSDSADKPEMAGEWAAFVHNIVSELTRENVALTYELNNVRISVPGSSGTSDKAQWIVEGSITIRGTKGH